MRNFLHPASILQRKAAHLHRLLAQWAVNLQLAACGIREAMLLPCSTMVGQQKFTHRSVRQTMKVQFRPFARVEILYQSWDISHMRQSVRTTLNHTCGSSDAIGCLVVRSRFRQQPGSSGAVITIITTVNGLCVQSLNYDAGVLMLLHLRLSCAKCVPCTRSSCNNGKAP